jgi:hypothetical protein
MELSEDEKSSSSSAAGVGSVTAGSLYGRATAALPLKPPRNEPPCRYTILVLIEGLVCGGA